jgi:Flp pilus assembly protein TadG
MVGHGRISRGNIPGMQRQAMTKSRFVAKLRAAWRSFPRASHGNTSITFALAFIPILGLVGASIDYSRANSMRTAMQAAADTTALAISSTAATQSASDLTDSANTYFHALFTRTDAQNLQVTATYSSTNGSTVVVNASANMKTNIMGILGFNTIPVATSATASWGGAKLRVALVLDNTGSMTQTDATGTSKISALKTATHNLLTTLRNAAQNPGDVEVSIIPFANFVKVDAVSYRSMSWISWGLNSGSGGSGDDGGSGGCNGGDDDSPCNPTSSSWNGCFTDRNQPYDSQNTPPTSTNLNTYFPAVNCSLTQLMSLSHDWTALNSKVDAMVAAGTTNQPIGLVWGWHSLSSSAPMSAPTLPSGTKQIIILLTDGLNTQDRWSTNQSYIDAREAAVCSNIKAAGVTIYTVLVMSGNSSVLQSCASPDTAAPAGPKYFALTSATQIISTFNSIGINLAKLHMAK